MIECTNDCALYIDFTKILGYHCQISITPWQQKIHWTNLTDPAPSTLAKAQQWAKMHRIQGFLSSPTPSTLS